MEQKATIAVAGLKVAVPLAADALPRDLVPPDGPPGDPVLELVLGDPTRCAIRSPRSRRSVPTSMNTASTA